jgi:hypothetical protein
VSQLPKVTLIGHSIGRGRARRCEGQEIPQFGNGGDKVWQTVASSAT